MRNSGHIAQPAKTKQGGGRREGGEASAMELREREVRPRTPNCAGLQGAVRGLTSVTRAERTRGERKPLEESPDTKGQGGG